MQISHETIYRCIYAYPKGELKKMMVSALRRKKSQRGPRGSKSSNYSSVKVDDDQFIHCRPEEIKQLKVAGHWQGDLIAGSKNQSCIRTLVEQLMLTDEQDEWQNDPSLVFWSSSHV